MQFRELLSLILRPLTVAVDGLRINGQPAAWVIFLSFLLYSEQAQFTCGELGTPICEYDAIGAGLPFVLNSSGRTEVYR